jgi:hypothetical protein
MHLGPQPGILGPGLLGVDEQALGDLAQLVSVMRGLIFEDQDPQDPRVRQPGLIDAR